MLTPATRGENGYRYYGKKEIDRLQQIQYYRKFNIPLKEIKVLLDQETNHLLFLKQQQQKLLEEKANLEDILETLLITILREEENLVIEDNMLFHGLEEDNNSYGLWTISVVLMMKARFLAFLLFVFEIGMMYLFLSHNTLNFGFPRMFEFWFVFLAILISLLALLYYLFFISDDDKTIEDMMNTYQKMK